MHVLFDEKLSTNLMSYFLEFFLVYLQFKKRVSYIFIRICVRFWPSAQLVENWPHILFFSSSVSVSVGQYLFLMTSLTSQYTALKRTPLQLAGQPSKASL